MLFIALVMLIIFSLFEGFIKLSISGKVVTFMFFVEFCDIFFSGFVLMQFLLVSKVLVTVDSVDGHKSPPVMILVFLTSPG